MRIARSARSFASSLVLTPDELRAIDALERGERLVSPGLTPVWE
ncbi:MAG: hypothetical protein ACRYF7_14190 [Janthinobacterium lividum]